MVRRTLFSILAGLAAVIIVLAFRSNGDSLPGSTPFIGTIAGGGGFASGGGDFGDPSAGTLRPGCSSDELDDLGSSLGSECDDDDCAVLTSVTTHKHSNLQHIYHLSPRETLNVTFNVDMDEPGNARIILTDNGRGGLSVQCDSDNWECNGVDGPHQLSVHCGSGNACTYGVFRVELLDDTADPSHMNYLLAELVFACGYNENEEIIVVEEEGNEEEEEVPIKGIGTPQAVKDCSLTGMCNGGCGYKQACLYEPLIDDCICYSESWECGHPDLSCKNQHKCPRSDQACWRNSEGCDCLPNTPNPQNGCTFDANAGKCGGDCGPTSPCVAVDEDDDGNTVCACVPLPTVCGPNNNANQCSINDRCANPDHYCEVTRQGCICAPPPPPPPNPCSVNQNGLCIGTCGGGQECLFSANGTCECHSGGMRCASNLDLCSEAQLCKKQGRKCHVTEHGCLCALPGGGPEVGGCGFDVDAGQCGGTCSTLPPPFDGEAECVFYNDRCTCLPKQVVCGPHIVVCEFSPPRRCAEPGFQCKDDNGCRCKPPEASSPLPKAADQPPSTFGPPPESGALDLNVLPTLNGKGATLEEAIEKVNQQMRSEDFLELCRQFATGSWNIASTDARSCEIPVDDLPLRCSEKRGNDGSFELTCQTVCRCS